MKNYNTRCGAYHLREEKLEQRRKETRAVPTASLLVALQLVYLVLKIWILILSS